MSSLYIPLHGPVEVEIKYFMYKPTPIFSPYKENKTNSVKTRKKVIILSALVLKSGDMTLAHDKYIPQHVLGLTFENSRTLPKYLLDAEKNDRA